MHKIIKKYIETNNGLLKLLEEERSKNETVEEVFLKCIRLTNENIEPNEIYEEIDKAIIKGHPDEEVFLLFISYLIVFFHVKDMREKADSTFRVLSSFDVTKYHPEIQAFYYQSCSRYYHYSKDFEKRDEANLIAISKTPKDSPRYQRSLVSSGQIFGLAGRLQELPKENLMYLERDAEKNFASAEAIMLNALFTANINSIDKYYSEIVEKFKDEIINKIEYIKATIAVLKGDFEEKNKLDKDLVVCLPYYKALKNGDLEKAKKIFGNMQDEYLEPSLLGVFYFANYHHAFVTGRYEVIENIIKNTEKQHEHYMLDFFLMRYYLIRNKKDLAGFYYARLIKSCEKYLAMGRLKFEMQFAFELSAISFLDLTQPLQMALSEEISKALEVEMISPAVVLLGLNIIIGNSNGLVDIKNKIKKFADIQRPILIVGETGAGKEVVARAIHEESVYKNEPFLAINCGALTDTLLQSELFGYESGAFTGAVTAHKGIFEAAEKGVVFLDEFGEMSQKLQVSLLRVLENNEILRVGGTKVKPINCRIIAATNANIEDLIAKKSFREDLYQRLKQFTISIPALRERKEDIPELIQYFMNQQNDGQLQNFSPELMLKFQEYHWPGNIRELKNEVDRIKILCGYKPIIEVSDIEIEWLKNDLNFKEKKELLVNSSENKQTENAEQEIHQRLINKKLSVADKRSQQIMKLFQQYKKLKRGQIAEALQVSLVTMSKDLQRLLDEGFLIQKKPTLSPRSFYFELVEDKNEG